MTDPEENLKNRILKEATHLFVRRGSNGISMREIADACGVSKAGLYYYFTDKESLLLAILEGYLSKMAQILQSVHEETGSNREKISRIILRIFAEPPDNRAIIRLASDELPNLNPEIRKRFTDLYHTQFVGQFEQILSEGVRCKEFRSMDTSVCTWILLGMMYPFFTGNTDRSKEEIELTINELLTLFFDGVVNRGD